VRAVPRLPLGLDRVHDIVLGLLHDLPLLGRRLDRIQRLPDPRSDAVLHETGSSVLDGARYCRAGNAEHTDGHGNCLPTIHVPSEAFKRHARGCTPDKFQGGFAFVSFCVGATPTRARPRARSLDGLEPGARIPRACG
jgi:hypothetical protein